MVLRSSSKCIRAKSSNVKSLKIELVGKFMHFVSSALQIISSSAMQKNSAPTGSQGRLTGDAACSEVGATLQGPVLLDCRLHLQRSKEVLHSAVIWFHVTRKHRTNIVPRWTQLTCFLMVRRLPSQWIGLGIQSLTCSEINPNPASELTSLISHSECLKHPKKETSLLLLVLLHHANAFLHGSHWTTTTREKGFQWSRRFLCQLFFNILFGSLSCGTSNLTFQSCHLKSGIYHSHLFEHKGCFKKNNLPLVRSHVVKHGHTCSHEVHKPIFSHLRFMLKHVVSPVNGSTEKQTVLLNQLHPSLASHASLLPPAKSRRQNQQLPCEVFWDKANLILPM